jgi:hypothetical protein
MVLRKSPTNAAGADAVAVAAVANAVAIRHRNRLRQATPSSRKLMTRDQTKVSKPPIGKSPTIRTARMIEPLLPLRADVRVASGTCHRPPTARTMQRPSRRRLQNRRSPSRNPPPKKRLRLRRRRPHQ